MNIKKREKRVEVMNELHELRKKGKTVKDISRILGLPFGTIASLIRRGKINRYCKKCGNELKDKERSFCKNCATENALEYSRKYMHEKQKRSSLKIKICPICKNKFITRRSEKIYCCEDCAKFSWNENTRKWQIRNRSENGMYNNNMMKGFISFDEDGNFQLDEFRIGDFPFHGDLFSIDRNRLRLGSSNLGSHPSGDKKKEQVLIENEIRRLGIKK